MILAETCPSFSYLITWFVGLLLKITLKGLLADWKCLWFMFGIWFLNITRKSRNFHAFTQAYLAHAQTNFPAALISWWFTADHTERPRFQSFNSLLFSGLNYIKFNIWLECLCPVLNKKVLRNLTRVLIPLRRLCVLKCKKGKRLLNVYYSWIRYSPHEFKVLKWSQFRMGHLHSGKNLLQFAVASLTFITCRSKAADMVRKQ